MVMIVAENERLNVALEDALNDGNKWRNKFLETDRNN